MASVLVLRPFYEDGRTYQPGDTVTVPDTRAERLAALGLVVIEAVPAPGGAGDLTPGGAAPAHRALPSPQPIPSPPPLSTDNAPVGHHGRRARGR